MKVLYFFLFAFPIIEFVVFAGVFLLIVLKGKVFETMRASVRRLPIILLWFSLLFYLTCGVFKLPWIDKLRGAFKMIISTYW